MGQFVNLTSQDGFVVPAWVAQPDGAPRGAVVVLQEIFGVNSHIRAVADRFAARGYLAVAPATFARVQPDVDLGYSEADMGVGFGFKTAVEALPGASAMPDRPMPAITGPREKPRIRSGVKEKSSFSQGAKKASGISGK